MIVWCGIVDNRIIGAIFLEENLNKFRCQYLSEQELPDALADVPFDLRQRMWFQ